MVLWSKNLKMDSLEILKDPKIKRIAMANPKTSPLWKSQYGSLRSFKTHFQS
ncbi:hypothetical protein BTM333_03520 [Helicobacter pylori]